MKKILFKFYFKGLREIYANNFRQAVKEINNSFPEVKKLSVIELKITEIR